MEEKSMWKKLKKNNKKGFTLVELIVVLVILAILAALLIPALTGYIDKAKEKQIIAETRQVVMAAQTLVDEEYAMMDGTSSFSFDDTDSSNVKTDGTINVGDIEELSELTIAWADNEITTATSPRTMNISVANGKIAKVTYSFGGKLCTYDGSEYTVK